MKKVVALLVITALCGFGQDGTPMNSSQGPPYIAYTALYFYDGSSQLEYICKARSQQPSFPWTRAASTLTGIGDSSNTATVTTSTAHGLSVGNVVTISGATVDSDLNGSYFIQTVGSTTTYTITTASVTDATYTEATLAVVTQSPRTTAPIWDIVKFIYSSSLITHMQHAGGKSSTNSICGNRAVTTGSTKIAFQ